MIHYFNGYEGNGQSHTFCGAPQSVEVYRAWLEYSEAMTVKVCAECYYLATIQGDMERMLDC